ADDAAAVNHRDGSARGIVVVQVLRDAQNVEDRGHQVERANGGGLWDFGLGGGFADDLAHAQAAASQGEGGQGGPVIAAGAADDAAAVNHRDGSARGIVVVQVLRDAQNVEDRGHQVERANGGGLWDFGLGGGFADDLAHAQAAASQGEGGQGGPVIAAGAAVD